MWVEHTAHMEQHQVHTKFWLKTHGKRPFGVQNHRWEDIIKWVLENLN